jgi:SAM-dependent methyltransferase
MPVEEQVTVLMNTRWFLENKRYIEEQGQLECYRHIQRIVEREVRGVRRLLDVGNGGFFNYDTSLAEHVTAVDLFLSNGPGPKSNSTLCRGSFLDLPFPDRSFDCVLQQNVLHHVTGGNVSQNQENLRTCMKEMYRCLVPGGKAVVIESTVGPVFYAFEMLVYRAFLMLKRRGHPVTFQHTPQRIIRAAAETGFKVDEFTYVPRGAFLLQYGYKWPSLLTPARPIKLILRR